MLWWAEYGCDTFSRQISLHLFLLCFFSKFYKAFLVVITLQNILSVLEKPLSWLSSQTTVAGGTEVSFWWAISLSLTPFLLFFYLQFIFVCLCFEAIIQLKTNSQSLFICSFSSVQLLSHVRLFATPWIAARQASLSITNSRRLLKLMSIESVMPSSHLIHCRPLILLPSIPPSIRVFSNESTLRMRWPKYWEFQLQHQSFQWTPRTGLL